MVGKRSTPYNGYDLDEPVVRIQLDLSLKTGDYAFTVNILKGTPETIDLDMVQRCIDHAFLSAKNKALKERLTLFEVPTDSVKMSKGLN